MASTFFSWIRSPAAREYFFSTHFWGPVANFGLPLAAISDLSKDEELISGTMTATLTFYSLVFTRFGELVSYVYCHSILILTAAWRVHPRNYLLFACHTTNALAQSVQGIRFVNYWHYGGRERKHGLTDPNSKAPVTPVLQELAKSDPK